MKFRRATKHESRLRLAFIGPAGSGKTYSSLLVAQGLGGRIAVIDSERGSASKYADRFAFDALNLETFSPDTYVAAIRTAEEAGYDVLIIDSLSHAWMGKDGALAQVDDEARRSKSGNTYTAWRKVTPKHNRMVDALVGCKCHLIVTMRSKTEYILEVDPKTKKQVPRKVGMAPIQRDGLEYEFDVVGDIDHDNVFIVSKTRCPPLHEAVIEKPGAQLAETLKQWLSGEPEPTPNNEADEEHGAKTLLLQIQEEIMRRHPGKDDGDARRDLFASAAGAGWEEREKLTEDQLYDALQRLRNSDDSDD